MSSPSVMYAERIIRIDPAGLLLTAGEQTVDIQWRSIRSLYTFKHDLFTIDTIYLLFIDEIDRFICVREETKGWEWLIEEILTYLPSIDSDWYSNVVLPAFATNLTLLYGQEDSRIEAYLT